MNVDLGHVLTLVAVVAPSVILHEVAHGAAALAFGDDTARREGRLSLNPLVHVDPFGTVLLPLLLSLTSLGAFGWAKPVPVDVRRLRRPRQHALYVSLAGPFTNIVLAVGAAAVLRFLRPEGTAFDVAVTVGFVNVVLAAFNLLPVPPLDGSALVERVLPAQWWPTWLRIRQWSMGVIVLVVLAAPGVLDAVFRRAIDLWARLL